MANRYTQVSNQSVETHFSSAVTGELVHSTMTATPVCLTTFNGGEIIPIYYKEVLPDETLDLSVDFVIRTNTMKTPTMGELFVDIYAFEVPNRVVNQSWKNVNGENPNGSWTATPVSVAPLWDSSVEFSSKAVEIPVGSVADYYGFPTQLSIPTSTLSLCNDLKFRGYIEIYNEFFRDQNYQPPIPYSKLNVYEGFLTNTGARRNAIQVNTASPQDGSYQSGAVKQAVLGNMPQDLNFTVPILLGSEVGLFSAKNPPLKANKLHDQFTSVLPSPQKGPSVSVNVGFSLPETNLAAGTTAYSLGSNPLRVLLSSGTGSTTGLRYLTVSNDGSSIPQSNVYVDSSYSNGSARDNIVGINLHTVPVSGEGSIDVSDLRQAAAIQQVYEQLGRGGSRYREFVRSFFGLDVEDPYKDIPCYLGHIRRTLEAYQTAQTSPSESGSTPQANLAAFGYTSSGGHLFEKTFLEHGYVHVFAVVRHRNLYSSMLSRDNFRLNMLDWYLPQLANISEQPLYTREINPFGNNPSQVFGYQEPWFEYRYEPDRVTGYMRPGISESLSLWNYADDFNSSLAIATGAWLKSNTKEVLDRTLAVTSSVSPQFKGQFMFKSKKTLPMPTYSIPGMDII